MRKTMPSFDRRGIDIDRWPLLQRGWVYQEMALSPRVSTLRSRGSHLAVPHVPEKRKRQQRLGLAVGRRPFGVPGRGSRRSVYVVRYRARLLRTRPHVRHRQAAGPRGRLPALRAEQRRGRVRRGALAEQPPPGPLLGGRIPGGGRGGGRGGGQARERRALVGPGPRSGRGCSGSPGPGRDPSSPSACSELVAVDVDPEGSPYLGRHRRAGLCLPRPADRDHAAGPGGLGAARPGRHRPARDRRGHARPRVRRRLRPRGGRTRPRPGPRRGFSSCPSRSRTGAGT